MKQLILLLGMLLMLTVSMVVTANANEEANNDCLVGASEGLPWGDYVLIDCVEAEEEAPVVFDAARWVPCTIGSFRDECASITSYDILPDEDDPQYQNGYQAGFESGEDKGESDGEKEGYAKGQSAGSSSGYVRGYDVGHMKGYMMGKTEGHMIGKMEGHMMGLAEGYAEAAELVCGLPDFEYTVGTLVLTGAACEKALVETLEMGMDEMSTDE